MELDDKCFIMNAGQVKAKEEKVKCDYYVVVCFVYLEFTKEERCKHGNVMDGAMAGEKTTA